MKTIPAIALVALIGATCASAAQAGDVPQGQRALWAMLCTQEGAAKGYKGKELEDFVAKCIETRRSGGGTVDTAEPPEAINC